MVAVVGYQNAVNATQDGIQTINSGVWTGSEVDQYETLVAGPTNDVVSIATGTSGQVLTSNGVAANPSYQSVSATGAITTITGDMGGPEVPLSGNFNILGTGSVTVVGSAHTETVQLTGLSNHNVLVGAGSATITNVSPSTAGFVLTSNGLSVDPSFQNVSISGAITTITGNSGGAESPTAGNFNVVGTGSITVAGTASTETVQLTGLTNHNVLVGAGTATITNVAPSATAGIPFISSGSSADPTYGTAIVGGGGTGSSSFTTYGPVVAGATSTTALVAIAPSATTGIPFVSQGAAANPAFSTCVVAGGGTGITSATAYAPIVAGTTTTGAFQVASTGLSTSGFVLTSNGAAAVPAFKTVGTAGAITVINVQTFTGSGTYTASASLKYAQVRAVGGGGGGGGAKSTNNTSANPCSGGASGSYAEAWFTGATIGASQTVTIGAAGAAGANTGTNGGTGGTTSLGSLVSCPGGGGGEGKATSDAMQSSTGGPPGAAPTITSAIASQTSAGAGGGGGYGFYSSGSANNAISGMGGDSPFGGGGYSASAGGTATAGNAGTGFGAGGSGAATAGTTSGVAGGAGTAGFVVVVEYCNQ